MDMEKWSGVVDWIRVCSECGPASKIRPSDGVFLDKAMILRVTGKKGNGPALRR